MQKVISSGREEELCTELSSDRSLMINFSQTVLSSFWLNV